MPELLTRHTANSTSASERESTPKYLPSVAESVTALDIHITELTFFNTSASAVSVTVTDGQPSPVAVLSGLVINANSAVGFVWKGRLCPGGFSWLASTAGVVSATARGYR